MKKLMLLVGLAALFGGKAEGSVAGFLTAEVPEFRITNLTLPEAVKVLREEAQKVLGWEPPEVRVVRPEERVPTRDFPFRKREMLMTLVIKDSSVYECLWHISGICGHAVELGKDAITLHEVPSAADPPFPKRSDFMSAAEFEKLELPEFKAEGLTLKESWEKLRETVIKATGKEPPLFAIVEYGEATTPINKLSLDLRKVRAIKCVEYVTTLSGYGYKLRGERIEAHALFTLYHPRHTRVFALKDFARAMKLPEKEVTFETIVDWFEKELESYGLPAVGGGGIVVVERLTPEDEDKLRRKFGIQRLD